jgi:hypothetical protein
LLHVGVSFKSLACAFTFKGIRTACPTCHSLRREVMDHFLYSMNPAYAYFMYRHTTAYAIFLFRMDGGIRILRKSELSVHVVNYARIHKGIQMKSKLKHTASVPDRTLINSYAGHLDNTGSTWKSGDNPLTFYSCFYCILYSCFYTSTPLFLR